MTKREGQRLLAVAAGAVAVSGAALVAGCGSSDEAPALQGRLLDAAVEGLSYKAAPSGRSGTTDAQGGFSCSEGDRVEFTLGGTSLGSARCAALVTPMDLAAAQSLAEAGLVNRLLFLQVLDEDDVPANGIRLVPGVAAALAGRQLDFAAPAASFDTALAASLPAGVMDSYGQAYAARTLNDRRVVAVDHFEGTLASAFSQASTSATAQASAQGSVAITKHDLQAAAALFVPYEGTNPAARKDFPNGFFPAVGSGLAFKGRAADGSLEFWGITDRGPNGDSPNAPVPGEPAKTGLTKMFPAPAFTPSIGVIGIGKDGAVLKSLLPLKSANGARISGRPLPAGTVGNSGEAAITDGLVHDPAKVGFDPEGLDSESLVFDAARKAFWTSDEYGPFIVRIDADSGIIQRRYAPGPGAKDLPEVLKHRRANRGMEGLGLDPGTGRLNGFLQSPIDPLDAAGKSIEAVDAFDLDRDGKTSDKVRVRDHAPFARWIEFDPATETSRLYAYPLSHPLAAAGGSWDRHRTGSAKLGDLVALGGGKFIVIEQGADAAGKVRNFLMLVERPAAATDITALGTELELNAIDGATAVAVPWNQVVPLRKTVLLDLNAAGWLAEKAEGLALVDAQTLALINDNDFGLRSILVDAAGKPVDGDPTACTVTAAGTIVADGSCAAGAAGVRVTRGNNAERSTRLWLMKFPKPLAGYSP